LAPYEVKTVEVEMLQEDREKYEMARECYIKFLRKARINFEHPNGWSIFLRRISESPEGRQAFQAYLLQKKLSQASGAKLKRLWNLIRKHQGDRILVFTQDNEMAYRIGRRFLLPVLTHHTKLLEREAFLKAFRTGEYPVIITSKVLNEGVDVPDANVGIIVSGSGSIREHVQRLGRILRARPGKQAMLYELVSQNTGEYFTNQRRRKHRAYEGTAAL
jgi:superfamily II DNA or RNA helicase